MGRYVLRRVLINIPVLLVVTMIVFALAVLAPGDPLDQYINPELGTTKADLVHLRAKFGLDDPLAVRYVKWLAQTLRGNLGYRYKTGDPVGEILWLRLKNTLLLMGSSLSLGIIVGVSLGVFVSLRQYSFWDFSLTGLSFIGLSMPAFIAGIFGLYVFSVRLHLFPSGGMWTIGKPHTVEDLLYHVALPACTLAIFSLTTYMRYTRFSMLEVIQQDYIRTARSKGLKEHTVVLRHALRNAMLPVVTIIGLSIRGLVAGALFLETIYSWPGMGSLFMDAVTARDYPMIMGINLVSAIVVLGANLLTDLAYSVVDPRIRYD